MGINLNGCYFTAICRACLLLLINLLMIVVVYFCSDGLCGKPIVVQATPGRGSDTPVDIAYTDSKVIGNGSFGVVYQAKLIQDPAHSSSVSQCNSGAASSGPVDVAIKKVLQDKRFKVSNAKVRYFNFYASQEMNEDKYIWNAIDCLNFKLNYDFINNKINLISVQILVKFSIIIL